MAIQILQPVAVDEKVPEKAEHAKREREFRIHRRFTSGWFIWPFIILVVYPLSIGPAFRFFMCGYGYYRPFADCVGFIYTPLFALARVAPPFGEFLFWYLDLWGWRPVFA